MLAEPGAQVSRLMEPVELGLVYHVMTPRAESANPHSQTTLPHTRCSSPGRCQRREGGRVGSYNRILKRIDTFNRDWIDRSARLATKREAAKTTSAPRGSRARSLHPPLVSIRERFAIADALALYYKPRVIDTLKLLFLLVFLAALAFDLFAHVDVLRHPPAMLLACWHALYSFCWGWRTPGTGG